MCPVLVVFALPLASLAGAQTRSEDVGQPPDTTIAVAPFLNLSRQSEDDWIGVGIAETVSIDLGNLGWSVGAQPVLVEALDQASQADGLWQPVEAVLERCRDLLHFPILFQENRQSSYLFELPTVFFKFIRSFCV